MTIKEIAELTGKTDRAIRKWVEVLAEKSSVIAEKSSASNSSHPADYTLEETIEILKAGNISEFIINALINETKRSKEIIKNESDNDRIDRLENLIEKLILSLPNVITQTIMTMNNQHTLEYRQDYFTLKAWHIKNKYVMPNLTDLRKLGKEAVLISREMNKEVKKADDETYGQVNSYHKEVLEKVFEI